MSTLRRLFGLPDRIAQRRAEDALSHAESEREIAEGLKRIGMDDKAHEHEREARRLSRQAEEYMRGMGLEDE